MASKRIEVDIIANDHASSVFNNVRASASSMSSRLLTALNGTAGFVGGFDNALRSYNSSMYRFNRLAISAAMTAGESVYNFTKDSINNYTELEKQHSKTMGAMATSYDKTAEAQAKFLEDSEKLKQQAKTLGTYGPNGNGSLNTITDVAYAQTALIKSGMSADDILNTDAMESILKFAGGNDLGINEATTFAVNLGTVFDKPVEEWGKMLDQVTKAADISVIDVEDIMNSLTYTGGIASGLNRDLEEVLGIISVMGQAGLRGRVAGTGLQSFFTRILSAGELSDIEAGNAPTENAAELYDSFILSATDGNGTFKSMDEVAGALDTAMNEMNDQEQAWFAKKLFGLYQMKAAYALTGAVDEDSNLITDFIDQITNESEGANDIKYQLTQASQFGKIESLKNAWEGIKTDFGDKLSPVVSTVADELFAFLKDPQNYNINWDSLRSAIEDSGEEISTQYGNAIGEAVKNIGNFGIDATIIGEALAPEVSGILSGIGKLMSGDISGAIDDFKTGIDNTNTAIDGLPEDLQGTAEGAKNVIAAFSILSGVNLATNILQVITSAFNLFIAKPISAITSKINSGKADVATASTTINTTAVNIGSVPLMNVNANIVNVYGATSFPNSGFPNTGVPMLPGGSGIPPVLALPGKGGSSGIPPLLLGPGKAQAAGLTAAGMAKLIPFAAAMVALSTVPSAQSQPAVAYQYGFGMDYENYLGEDYKNIDSFKEFMHDIFATGGTWVDDGRNYKWQQFKETQVDSVIPNEYRQARDDLFNSIEGLSDYTTGQQYLAGLMDRWYYENASGNSDFITQDQYIELAASLVNAMGQYITEHEVEDPSVYANEVPGQDTDIYTNILAQFTEALKSDDATNNINTNIDNVMEATKGIMETLSGLNIADAINTISQQNLVTPYDEIMGKLTQSFEADYGTTDSPDIAANAQAITEGAQAITESSQGVVEGSQSVVENSQTVVEGAQGVVEASQGVIESTQSVIDSVNAAMERVQQPIINVSVNTTVDSSGNASTSVTQDNLMSNLSRFG